VRYLLLSDIHGNLPAFRAVMEDALRRGFDRVLFMGDAVGYYPDGEAVLTALRKLEVRAVLGNHDAWLLDDAFLAEGGMIAEILAWQRGRLSPENLAYLKSWPWERRTEHYHQVHGSPCGPFVYVDDLEPAREALSCSDRPWILIGHTHLAGLFMAIEGPKGPWIRYRAFLEEENRVKLGPKARAILNPGSVGQPRDGLPLAAYAIWDDEAREIEAYRVPYDLLEVRRRLKQEGFPMVLYERLRVGR